MAGENGQPGAQQGGNGGPWGAANGQFQRELQQRLNDIENLRRELSRQGRDVSELDRAASALRGMGSTGSLSDDRAAKLLQAQVDAMKEFEFQLTKAVVGEKEGVRVGRVGDVAPAYRQWVDEYYREIGKADAGTTKRGKPPQ
jgi:predicted RNase H-like nuclease (RuvC/YqgF family)